MRAYEGALRDEMAPLFAGYDQLVFFVSLGAVVRLIAPVLKSKDEDPGVTVVDDAGSSSSRCSPAMWAGPTP